MFNFSKYRDKLSPLLARSIVIYIPLLKFTSQTLKSINSLVVGFYNLISPINALIIPVGVLFVVFTSVTQGAYNLDPHHWGLMTSNVVDLDRGRVPYKEIFIQYGFLTTLLEFLSFLIYKNITSIIFGVSLLYALGFVGVYYITLHFCEKRSLALYAFITAILIHHITIYPWSNYVSFPFITFGCFFVLRIKERFLIGFLGGVLLGAAVLARESLFLPLAPALLFLAPINFWCLRDWRSARLRLSPLVGFVLSLSIFGLYLWLNSLTYYWWQTSIELPKIYSETFLPNGPVHAILRMIKFMTVSSLGGDVRQIIFGLIIISAAGIWVLALFQSRKSCRDPDLLFVALLTGLLLSSAVHLTEVFRLATSVTVGIGLLYYLLDKFIQRAGIFFIVATAFLVFGILGVNNGNYFSPSIAQIKSATTSNSIPLFVGQRWSRDVFDYYNWYLNITRVLESRHCGLRFLKNNTRDAYLQALSPFSQYQLMPMGSGFPSNILVDDFGYRLRPDYDFDARLIAQDILIVSLQQGSPEEGRAAPDGHRTFNSVYIGQPAEKNILPPNGYKLFARRVTPKSWFIPDGHETVIFAPAKCVT